MDVKRASSIPAQPTGSWIGMLAVVWSGSSDKEVVNVPCSLLATVSLRTDAAFEDKELATPCVPVG